MGRLFAYGALARSGKLTEEWTADNNSELIKKFTKCLIDLAVKKRYLQEPAVAILLEIVGKVIQYITCSTLLFFPIVTSGILLHTMNMMCILVVMRTRSKTFSSFFCIFFFKLCVFD